ncbi:MULTISPECIES: 3-hydroxyacyl-ACP dehydratase FabZ family protein [Rhodopirellula]|jgi:3-hydroxyacyl-[acyl-carrier-protein] dehydratase|uniref:Hydroxymyristoyl-(Acyl carrier protein) dehydratase n=3 Tax=Rhodopirellula TaxID=265488 RepID=M2AC75_9BACT|nr:MULTISPECIES: 3-hydroxyacyl-ACP dehydratase FabZ family protein [Rhodopirellula]EMB14440.1 hydroxymyristoyl-(acyl carrier protein) dehydratase [Rhodopirellula europaea 6C]EMI29137.1 hydroxymyristoyl-(acyl carrier protein) dehydratase [Rhodopirellula europaea SH398]MCR9207174.1 beta-hydroxyacyl-ACP dehydratase [bacterium]PHQ35963.1 beta-hydroxyacyl-ACP dehydratase [Rhodopirellula bahusiensis]|tara:strand:+ start:588 stop:1094 length:507 start_codon:yes stop_codon:yes gene_type:complete
MRWFWVDRFTEFVSGSHASGVKNVALDEEVVDDYCLGYTMLPPTLIIEGLAQLGGILVHEKFGFTKRVVLAKVGSAKYYAPARPGDSLQYHVKLERTQDSGATVTGTSHCDGELQAEVDLMFAFLEEGHLIDGPLFNPGDLLAMMRMMNFFHVAVTADGEPIPFHENL